MQLLGKSFFKYDFRVSHNYYFNEKNLDLIFKKLNFKILKKEDITNIHLITFSIMFFIKRDLVIKN